MVDSSSSSDRKTCLYHPYEDLNIPIHNIYNLPTSPEFLFDKEALVQRRSWDENLQYYTGCGYLTGTVVGASKGSLEGLLSASGESAKLRINRVLNSFGHTEQKFDNLLGIVGLIFIGLESGIMAARDSTDDLMNSVVAGLGTGALYKAASGPRSAATVVGTIGGLAAGIAVVGKQAVKRYVSI